MRKIISSVTVLVLVIVSVLSLFVCANAEDTAENRLYFINSEGFQCVVDGKTVCGGYYTKYPTFVFDKNSKNGVTFHSTNENDHTTRCLWAIPEWQIKKTPFLHYVIPENNSALYNFTISSGWDIWPELEISIEPGEHILNLLNVLADYKCMQGYYYVVPYCTNEFSSKTASLNEFYLTDVGPEEPPVSASTETVTQPVETQPIETKPAETQPTATSKPIDNPEATSADKPVQPAVTTSDKGKDSEEKKDFPIIPIAIAGAVLIDAIIVIIIGAKKR